MTLLFLTLIATAVLAGILQGMYHVKPGEPMHRLYWWLQDNSGASPNSCNYEDYKYFVKLFPLGIRGHVWQKYEHLIWGAVIIGSMILGHLLISQFVTTWEYLVTLCLVFLVAWFCFEPAYNYARYKSIVPPDKREHVVFADLFSFHAPSVLMHTIRLMLIAGIAAVLTRKRKEK